MSYTSPGTTLTGLSHLNGETVYVWADGQERGNYTVASGQITVASSWTNVTVGLRHTATYQSNKLNESMPSSGYVAADQNKRVVSLGMVARNLWVPTFMYGSDANNLYPLPEIEDGKPVDDSATVSEYNELSFDFDGTYNPDSRVYIQAQGPVKVLALVYEIDDPAYQAAEKG